MKITKRQLKRIIKEEKQKLNEEYETSKESYAVCNDMIIELITELASMFSDGQLGDGAYDAMMAKDKTAHAILTQAAIAARQK
tara:strand:- start:11770 stop:12018 length:249 start_codon:yes stop_codon:yes gene_type:complete